jgi:hypothetical protein
MSDERDAFWQELDDLGEEEVRKRIGLIKYGERRAEFARAWLAHRESLLSAEDRHSSKALVSKTNDIAREADETAMIALKEARTSATIARLALIAAITAIAIAIAGILFR